MIIFLIIFSLFSTGGVVPTSIGDIVEQSNPDILKFDSTLIELGTITRGDVKEFEFHFTNVSDEDVEISLISSCDCTELDYPYGAIKPGEKGTIGVIFRSAEKTESETVDIDIDLVNTDKNGNPIFIRVNYSFILAK